MTVKTDTLVVDLAVFEWFCRARSCNILLTGPIVQEKSREAAAQLRRENFKACIGWLEKLRIRHNITFKSVRGEARGVDQTTADWISRLQSVLEYYTPERIYNAKKTAFFFRMLPDKSLCLHGEKCTPGKASKERLTILLCCIMTGDKENPLVTGKLAGLRCFNGLDIRKLPVDWHSNKKAWMTREITIHWLQNLERKMQAESKKILLFLDNVTCHFDPKLKNVKVVFFLAKTPHLLVSR
jgi:hypothetical protein